MLLQIPDVFTPDELARCRSLVESAEWADGNITAGTQSAKAKNNRQLPEDGEAARAARTLVLDALSRSALFFTAALPRKIYPPLFNRYGGEANAFGNHIDNAVRTHAASGTHVRTDLSATLFLAGPDEYDGGELVIEDTFGTQSVKLPAGHMILYPSSSVHRVEPVTRGVRIASFFWIQSHVADERARGLLFDLDRAIQGLTPGLPADDPNLLALTGVYHNLLRQWAST